MSSLAEHAPEEARARGRSARQGAHVIEMQRSRLLSGTLEILAEGGLEGASVGGVCKRAGISRRTFYEMFKDLEGCLIAAFDGAVARLAESVLPAYEAESTWTGRVRTGLIAALELLDAEPALARLCVIEAPRAGPRVCERYRAALSVVSAVIDEGRDEAEQTSTLSWLTAEGVVGGALSVIHARLLARLHLSGEDRRLEEREDRPLVELVNPLMAMVVQPYLGVGAASRELERPVRCRVEAVAVAVKDPFNGLSIRFTYRTALVLATIAANPGGSNRLIADSAGVADEGQMSRLLARLQEAGLIETKSGGQARGDPNAWKLTERGQAVHAALGVKA
jgi:AcrR family transcriptional regulator